MDKRYFEIENYKGPHIHIDNWEPFWAEAIAWERLDGSWDVMFYNFQSQEELGLLFGTKEYYKDEVGGVFLFNAQTDEECKEKFIKWVHSNLLPLRTNK
ncbi:hypothetical protein [Peribacillus frigoritolerans]|uniref:hypothetical protein n=1 Tax=Peribacillus frigoritolerans TaxID=450367 RepID=UPI0020C04CBE|nr:hypothetical protein [Peribacillus frigoritolerans]MEE3955668.1 hypothetical protein [Peribacillus frigoritolerans]